MKLLTYLTSLVAVASAVAVPARRGAEWQNCLAQSEAQKLVDEYIAILSHTSSSIGDANATAQAILDNGYQEISDSILSLEGQPVSWHTICPVSGPNDNFTAWRSHLLRQTRVHPRRP